MRLLKELEAIIEGLNVQVAAQAEEIELLKAGKTAAPANTEGFLLDVDDPFGMGAVRAFASTNFIAIIPVLTNWFARPSSQFSHHHPWHEIHLFIFIRKVMGANSLMAWLGSPP